MDAIITSNTVLNDQLKKKQVVGKGLGVQERNNAVSPMNMGIEDLKPKWPINSTPPKADPNPMVQAAAHACQFANSIKWPLVHLTGNFPFSKCEPMKLLSTGT